MEKPNRIFELCYKNGQLNTRCFYKDDVLHGPYEVWYDTGVKSQTSLYVDGLLEGLYMEWDRDGSLSIWCEFHLGDIKNTFFSK